MHVCCCLINKNFLCKLSCYSHFRVFYMNICMFVCVYACVCMYLFVWMHVCVCEKDPCYGGRRADFATVAASVARAWTNKWRQGCRKCILYGGHCILLINALLYYCSSLSLSCGDGGAASSLVPYNIVVLSIFTKRHYYHYIHTYVQCVSI